MKIGFLAAPILAVASWPAPALAQVATINQSIAGTRLDIEAAADVTRVPDIAIISAGVVTRSATASGALEGSASRMDRVLAALKRAGIKESDIQTGNVSLNPEYRYPSNESPQLVGYTASNMVNVRFRNIATSGKILDALVAEGANQINGPTLSVDRPEEALDEARAKAVAIGKARAELYAHALGMRVVRLVALSESGGGVPAPVPPMVFAKAETRIEPGDLKLGLSLHLVFELQ